MRCSATRAVSSAKEGQRRRPASDASAPEKSRVGGTASFVRSRRTRDGGPANKTDVDHLRDKRLGTDEVIAERLQRAMMNSKMTKLRSIVRTRRVSLSEPAHAVPHVAQTRKERTPKIRKSREKKGCRAAEDKGVSLSFSTSNPPSDWAAQFGAPANYQHAYPSLPSYATLIAADVPINRPRKAE